MACCAQHLTGDEWSSFLLAHWGALWARQLRTWATRVGNLVSSVPPQFQRCELTATPVASRATSSCVGPHCQCLAVQEFCERHALQGKAFHEQLKARRASIRLPKPGRPGEFWESVKVPLWVVSSSATRAVRAEGRETQGLFSVPREWVAVKTRTSHKLASLWLFVRACSALASARLQVKAHVGTP